MAGRLRRQGSVLVLAGALVAACASAPPPSGAPRPPATGEASAVAGPTGTARTAATTGSAGPSLIPLPTRADAWRADLARLLPAMENLHPKLDHDTPMATLEAAVDDLSARAGSLSDDELMVGVLRIVALVSASGRDAHTGAFVWGVGRYEVHTLPIRVWLFRDGPYVEDALGDARGLVGQRIVAIGDHPIVDVLTALDPLVPRDNAETVRLLLPRYLLVPEILHGLGLLADGDLASVPVTTVDVAGVARTTRLSPITATAYNAWAGKDGLRLVPTGGATYLTRMGEVLWHEVVPGTRTLYVAYNRVEAIDRDELAEVARLGASPSIERVVVDVRNNLGGEVDLDEPLLAVLADAKIAKPGRLWLLTGRDTFSAASLFVAKLEARTPVTIVGEPMGGAPTSYGNPWDVSLDHSGLQLSVSTQLEVAVSPGDPRLTIAPDVPIALTAADYFAGRDPALQAILGR